MKVTKSQLKKIIKEELSTILKEADERAKTQWREKQGSGPSRVHTSTSWPEEAREATSFTTPIKTNLRGIDEPLYDFRAGITQYLVQNEETGDLNPHEFAAMKEYLKDVEHITAKLQKELNPQSSEEEE
jgi:hypothetical protein